MDSTTSAADLYASTEATRALGAAWAARCVGGEIFALHGPLGAGKTELVKGLARGLGFPGEVTSPTFALLHEYLGGRLPLYHFDLYRIAGAREAVQFGIEEYLEGGGVAVVEWPERIAEIVPPQAEHWEIALVSETARRIVLRR